MLVGQVAPINQIKWNPERSLFEKGLGPMIRHLSTYDGLVWLSTTRAPIFQT